MTLEEWNQTVETIGPRLHRYFKFKGAGDLASDLTQETFVRLVQKFSSFDSRRGPLVAFALGMAQLIWLESRRRQRPMTELTEQNEAQETRRFEDDVADRSDARRLRLLVAELPQVQQDILYLYFDEEITTREISNVLKIPEGTVKSHLHRAKESIRLMMQSQEKERL